MTMANSSARHNKLLEAVMLQDGDFDSELSDFEDIGTPYPRGAHLSDSEISPKLKPGVSAKLASRDRQKHRNKQTADDNMQKGKAESSVEQQLEEFYEERVRSGLKRKETCEDIAYAVTHKVLRKVQTVDDRFRASNLIPHGIPYDGLKAGEPIFFDMILNLSLGLRNTLYVKKDNGGAFVRIQPMSTEFWSDCLTINGCISASKIQHMLRKYVKQAVHILRKYISQGRKEKYPQNLKSLFIDGATGVTLIINRDIKVRVLPAFPIPDSRNGRDCPSSSHVVCCARSSLQHDFLSVGTTSELMSNEKGIETAWRVSFYVAEKNKMRALGEGCRVQLLRILTEIRDNEDALKNLSSYHLKTILFNQSAEMPSAEDWLSEKLSERFFDLLKSIQNCLVTKSCPHFFMKEPEFQSVNLFEGIDDETLTKMADFVGNMIENPEQYLILERNKQRAELWPWEAEFVPIAKD